MKLLDWHDANWRKRFWLVLTVLALVLLASHPELRLLIPLFDSLGLDLVLLLVGSQFLDVMKPALLACLRYVLLPAARALYTAVITFLGIVGPTMDARVAIRFPRLRRALA